MSAEAKKFFTHGINKPNGELAGYISDHPQAVKDPGLKQAGLEDALSLYRKRMRGLGVCPIDIKTSVERIERMSTTRNGVFEVVDNIVKKIPESPTRKT